MILEIEEVGIVIKGNSEWGAACQFPPKKLGSLDFRMVYDYRGINTLIVKSTYLMHLLDIILYIVI